MTNSMYQIVHVHATRTAHLFNVNELYLNINVN